MVETWAAKLCNEGDAVTTLHDSSFLGHDFKLMGVTSPPLMWTCRAVKLRFRFLENMAHSSSMLQVTMGYDITQHCPQILGAVIPPEANGVPLGRLAYVLI